jgi:LacI family transcriptional regulator
MPKVTIQEVARQAGVSKGTVSRVLNGRDEVNADTRSSVLEIVKRLRYVPDPGARKLARKGRHQIGLAFSDGDAAYGPYYTVLLDALQERFMSEVTPCEFSSRDRTVYRTKKSMGSCF